MTQTVPETAAPPDRHPVRRRVVVAALLIMTAAASLAPALPALADRDRDSDHERARAALDRGDILPLARILSLVEGQIDGRVIEVEFDRHHGRYLYELEILTPDGRLIEVNVDAADGKIMGRHGKGDDD